MLLDLIKASGHTMSWFYRLIFFFSFLFIGDIRRDGTGVVGYRQCPSERGGGVCPDYATCCATNTPGVSSCITSKKTDPLDHGDCCNFGNHSSADDDSVISTGCGIGFQCASDAAVVGGMNDTTTHYCQRRRDAPDNAFPQCQKLPRYDLCSIPKGREDILKQVYGFPLAASSTTSSTSGSTWQLAYYSNMKSITVPNNQHLNVETVWIVVHGSSRNPDDYLCCAMSSMPSSAARSSSVLIVSPWYVAPEDGPINITSADEITSPRTDNGNNDQYILKWSDPGPIKHTWRYGADSISGNISSYDTVDALVGYFAKAQVQFPKLQNIVVAGHSAGGQFVHRWSLLSNSPVWGDLTDATTEASYTSIGTSKTFPRSLPIRVVAANPRSYCYMDGRRIVNSTFRLPNPDVVASCTIYNTWQWGLDDDDGHGSRGLLEPLPYRDRALIHTPRERLVNRYATRSIFYLLGEYDTLPLKDQCATEKFQGMTRHERGQNYYQALQAFFENEKHGNSDDAGNDNHRPRLVHVKLEASRSPHDHCLMFQSPQGQQALGFASSKWA